jgi:tRNA (cmo5U34)-methyltransferase
VSPGAADVNLWTDAAHAQSYLDRRSSLPWQDTAYEHLLEFVGAAPRRVLDLGSGDGLVAARIVESRPDAEVVACDFSAEMLSRARDRFVGITEVTVVEHDLDDPLPESWGTFDAVVSAFAIHHVVDERKRGLYGEVFDRLEPGGVFCNLEHVASATVRLHEEFLRVIGAEEDPSNKLASVDVQLAWLRDIGFHDVDCHYKWREVALLAGVRPV